MGLSSIRNQLARIRQSLPDAPTADAGAASRNARRLATIAAEAEPRRNIVVMLTVIAASGTETDEGYQALLDQIGQEALGRAFPDGVPQTHGSDFVRERARNYRPTGGTVNPLEVMITDAIKRRDYAAVVAAEEAQS